jgi:hypothetical protein
MSTTVAEQTSSGTSWGYLMGMESWTGAVFDLLAHAAEVADGPSARDQLLGARDDAEALRDLLRTANGRNDPNPHANATIESICALWDANEPRFERLAAEVDPAFYRRWCALAAMARMCRYGPPLDSDALLYSA